MDMISMNASKAREKLDLLLDETASDHKPVLITGPRSKAVLVGEEDWNSIQETLHLLSAPGMRESIVEGMATPADQCEREPGWRRPPSRFHERAIKDGTAAQADREE